MTSRRTFGSVLVGVLLIQASWILTTPTYRGIDEFDHVFKAAAVARGQWTSHGSAPEGRGGFVRIPGSIVAAAQDMCESFPYTRRDDCQPSKKFDGGDVQIATAAGNYNPAYYFIVGTVARPFGGDSADYVMRVVTAMMCALMIAWSAVLVRSWSRTPWPVAAFCAGLTPVMIYSTSMTSPNGVTYSGAALIWSALIAMSKAEPEQKTATYGWPASIGAVALVTTHTTGPMWLALVGLVTLALLPLRSWLGLMRRSSRSWFVFAAVVLIATLWSVAWTRTHDTNALGPVLEGFSHPSLGKLVQLNLLWVFQAIAAFPALNETAPPIVYGLWLLLLAVPFTVLVRRATGRIRAAWIVLLAAIVIVPSVLSWIAYPHQGLAWQGRYTLPLWTGVIALAGVVLDASWRTIQLRLLAIPYVLMSIAMAVSTVHVGQREVSRAISDPAAAGIPGGFVVVGVLSAAGVLLLFRAVTGCPTAPRSAVEPIDELQS